MHILILIFKSKKIDISSSFHTLCGTQKNIERREQKLHFLGGGGVLKKIDSSLKVCPLAILGCGPLHTILFGKLAAARDVYSSHAVNFMPN